MTTNLDDRRTPIGLGYVGLPLAVEFAKKYQTIGFDINQERVDEIGIVSIALWRLTAPNCERWYERPQPGNGKRSLLYIF